MGGNTAANQREHPPDLLLRQLVDEMMKLFTQRAHKTSLQRWVLRSRGVSGYRGSVVGRGDAAGRRAVQARPTLPFVATFHVADRRGRGLKEASEKDGVRVGKTPSETARLLRDVIKNL